MKKLGIGCLSILGVIFLIGIIGAIVGGSSVKKNTPTTSDQKQQGQKAEETQEEFKIGDQVRRGDTILTVNKVDKDWRSSNKFDKPQSPDDVFVVVNITLENQGKSDINLAGFWDFKLQDFQGVQRSEAIAAGMGLNKLSGQSVTSLSPGGKITGDLLFAVPKLNTDQMTLLYKPMVSFGSSAKIELQ